MLIVYTSSWWALVLRGRRGDRIWGFGICLATDHPDRPRVPLGCVRVGRRRVSNCCRH
jgi:hypothetical protein